MSVTLSQSGEAAYTDRGQTGLRCTVLAGLDGCYLSVGLGGELTQWHTRFVLRPNDVTGGELLVLQGVDAGGKAAFEVRFDADVNTITIVRGGAVVLTADLLAGLAWHTIELGVDATSDTMTLWVNGFETDSVAVASGGVPTQQMRFGVVYKQHGVVGEFDLDEWVIADDYIGPVSVQPSGDYADDPRRWAVIYNTALADSVVWAEHYRVARGVPCANMIGLSLPADEVVDETQFESLRDSVDDYLERNAMSSRVSGLLIGHGVPARYTRGDGYEESIAGQLQKINGVTAPIANPFAVLSEPARPRPTDHPGYRITARIDGPILADSVAVVDRALAIETQGLGDGSNATLWLDAVTTGSVYESMMNDMLAWAESLERQSLRLPLVATQPTDPPTDAGFGSVNRDGFVWGWRESLPPQGYFAEPAGLRVFAAQLDDFAITAPTLRDSQDTSWAITSLQAGYTATMGSSRPVSLTAMPRVRSFFEGLEAGWTLGEAWAVATPLIRSGVELIGDPLLSVRFPWSGWNVYGPFDSLGLSGFDTPARMLREDELTHAIAGEDQPDAGKRAVFVVRRVDAAGREETGATPALVGMDLPAWPAAPGWSPRMDDGRLKLAVVWADRFSAARVDRVELFEQVEVQAEQLAGVFSVAEGVYWLEVDRDLPVEPTRWRFVVWGNEGYYHVTPWSRYVRSIGEGVKPLVVL